MGRATFREILAPSFTILEDVIVNFQIPRHRQMLPIFAPLAGNILLLFLGIMPSPAQAAVSVWDSHFMPAVYISKADVPPANFLSYGSKGHNTSAGVSPSFDLT